MDERYNKRTSENKNASRNAQGKKKEPQKSGTVLVPDKKSKAVSEEERARFLSDDDYIPTQKPKKEAVKGKVIGKIDPKTARKRKKKKNKKIRRIKSSILLIAVLIAVFLAVSLLLFRVNTVNVYGNVRKTDEEIAALAGIDLNTHMWFFSAKKAEDRIEKDPYIVEANIKRSYPDTLSISVLEREAVAVIQSASAYAVIDSSGYVMSIDDAASYSDIMTVSGMGASGYKVGTYLGDENDFMAKTLFSILDAMTQSGIIQDVKSLDISNPLSIKMVMRSGIAVHMGQSDDASEKFEKLAKVLPWLAERGYTDGSVDISMKGAPVYSPPYTPTPAPTLTPTPVPTPTSDVDDGAVLSD